MIKQCAGCKSHKDTQEFRPNKSKKDGLQAYCIACDKQKQSEWYQQNKTHIISKQIVKNRLADHKTKQLIMEYLIDHPCVDCGENDPIVLEFDHIGVKTMEISTMVHNRCSVQTIWTEIEQCEVRCANCHRRKTAKDFGWFRSLWKYEFDSSSVLSSSF